jgi:RNA 2',3'-cyclic 3'-phosphodiesterase
MQRPYSASEPEGGEPSSAVAATVRLFVGLRITAEIASRLAQFAASLDDASVRPVAVADIHLTLVPPWNETSTPDAITKLAGVAPRFAGFPLFFTHVGYGPQPRRPRLLWVGCKAGNELIALRQALLQVYGQNDERPFQPHVTLARIRASGPAIAGKYPVDQALSLTQQVETVELFQSPPPGERGYRVVASSRLREMSGSATSEE